MISGYFISITMASQGKLLQFFGTRFSNKRPSTDPGLLEKASIDGSSHTKKSKLIKHAINSVHKACKGELSS